MSSPDAKINGGFLRHARLVFVVGAFSLAVYYILFRLPFLFPPAQRLVSASYAFGFNNGFAILALTGLLGAVTLFCLIRQQAGDGLARPFVDESSRHRASLLRMVFVIICAIYAVLTFAMFLYDRRAEPSLMWETRHLIHRMWVMDVYGVRPYTEISAEYGPILTYAPLYAYGLLKPLGASHQLAYFVSHFLLNIAGLWCVYYVLSRADMSGRARMVAFVLLAIAGFAPYMGVNGVLVRYLFPYASLLLGARLTASLLVSRSFVGTLFAAATVLLLMAGNILLSPEIGVAFSIAWIAYAILKVRSQPRLLVVSLIVTLLAGLLSRFLLPREYYETLLRFSEGANNLPLLPAPHLILYLVTLFLLVPPLLAAGVRGWRGEEAPGAAICGALGLLCIVVAPGALGRCDPPHVLLYGMGASMLLMIQLSRVSRRAFAFYAVAYAGVFVLFVEAVNMVVFYGMSPQTLLSRHPLTSIVQKLRAASGTTHPDAATLSALDRYPRLGLPFATFGDPIVERYVMDRRQLQPEYYVSIVGVYTPAAVEHKLRDLQKMDYLLVPRRLIDDNRSAPPANPCAGYRKSLRQWFLFPANLPCRADPLDASQIVTSFINRNYAIVDRIGSFLVLRRISGVAAARDEN